MLLPGREGEMGRPNEIGLRDCGWRQSAREMAEKRVEELIKSIITRCFSCRTSWAGAGRSFS
jgi:hypothetical protein